MPEPLSDSTAEARDLVVHLWTDGSGTTRGNPGGWAYILQANHPTTGELKEVEGFGGVQDSTNNRMELTAVLMGLRALQRPSTVVVHSDSLYVINPFRQGFINAWVKRDFAKVKNDDIWRELVVEHAKHAVTFEHVKGHSGVDLNERCDKLAGAERRKLLPAH